MSESDCEKHEWKEEEAPGACDQKPFLTQPTPNTESKKSKKKKKNETQKQPQKPVHIQGDSVLHYAVLSGQKENVEKLLTHGMRVQHQSAADGGTPLHRAAQVGNIEIAQVLINHGTDINAPNYLGQTPLHVALEKNNVDFAKFLLSKGSRKKCKHNWMRCQTFVDSQNKNKQENQRKKFMNRRNKREREPIHEPPQITPEEIQDHMIVECEHQNNKNNAIQISGPELICRDLTNVDIDDILPIVVQSHPQNNIDDDVGDINLSDEIKKEKKALGGPMFSKEENEKLRREKMRGGDFQEKSSESSNENSDPDSPDRAFRASINIVNFCPILEEKKQQLAQEKARLNQKKQKIKNNKK